MGGPILKAFVTGFFIFLKELRSKTSLIFLGAFCFLSFLVAAGLWQKTDVSVTVFLQSAATLGLDCFVTATGWLGSPEFTGLAALAGAVLIWRRYSTNLAAAFLSAMALATIIEMAAKLWVPQLPIPDEFQRGCGKLPGLFFF
ncbi:MAG: hypothetical protein HY747_00820 [Elusimicrobia bacterium]|nr:hypothetical protein [Elusimicrobiota bacterium]